MRRRGSAPGGRTSGFSTGSPQKKRSGKKAHVPLVNRWGHRKIKDMTRREIRDVLENIAERAPIMANRMLALVRKIFNFAIEHDWVETNPCHMIKALAPARQRDRVLNEDHTTRLGTPAPLWGEAARADRQWPAWRACADIRSDALMRRGAHTALTDIRL